MQNQKHEENPFEQVGTMRFLGMSFRLFQFGGHGRMWIPLMDLARGLGYANPKKLWELIQRNPHLFQEQGWILDLKLWGELVPPEGTNSAQGSGLFGGDEIHGYQPGNSSSQTRVPTSGGGGPKGTLLTCHEGVAMCCSLNRSEKADEFKIWAAKKLVPHMVRQGRLETPMDDWPPEARIKHYSEMRKTREKEANRKLITSPLYCARLLVREVVALKPDDPLRMEVFSILDEIKEKIQGPFLFSKVRPEK